MANNGMQTAQVLILAFTDLRRDMRIRRQIEALVPHCRVTAVGNEDPAIPGCAFVPTGFHEKTPGERLGIYSRYLLGRFEAAYWYPRWLRELRQRLQQSTYDVILANDTDTLPLACTLTARHGILFDAHEYSPLEFENSLLWRILFSRFRRYLCKTYIPRTTRRTTVASGIAQEYRQQFGLPFSLITNAPAYQDLSPHPTAEDQINMVHPGAALASRGIESMLQVMRYTDPRFHLHFYLMGNPRYIARLQRQAADLPSVHFHQPVPAGQLPATLNQYDIGLYLISGTNFNEKHSLPNKFFEFIQGRLAIAIGPSVEMRPYVQQYDLGIVAPSFQPKEMAAMLNALTAAEIDLFKQNSHQQAHTLSAQQNAAHLQALIAGMLADKPDTTA